MELYSQLVGGADKGVGKDNGAVGAQDRAGGISSVQELKHESIFNKKNVETICVYIHVCTVVLNHKAISSSDVGSRNIGAGMA